MAISQDIPKPTPSEKPEPTHKPLFPQPGASGPDQITPWPEIPENEDDLSIDFIHKPLLPLPLTHPKILHIKHQHKLNSDTSPIRIVIDGLSFWRKKHNGKGVQEWVFQRVDTQSQKVCVVLEWNRRRLYTSFPDAPIFWNYYVSFKGKRYF